MVDFSLLLKPQRAQARAHIATLDANPRDAAALARLRDVLADAQNPPPGGAADGSIDEPLWNALRAVADVLTAYQSARAHLSAVGR